MSEDTHPADPLDSMAHLIRFLCRRLAERVTIINDARTMVGPYQFAAVTASLNQAHDDIRAQRRLLDWCESYIRATTRGDWTARQPMVIHHMSELMTQMYYALRYLAVQYADHRSYRPEWKPGQ